MAAALLPFAVVAVVHWSQLPGENSGDYAQYLLHAKALAEGRPYGDIGYIYTDLNLVGPRNQPPGWPLVLTPIVAVFGVDTPLVKLLLVCCVAGFAVVAGLYFARREGLVAGASVAMLVPLALETQHATNAPISDPLACLVIWLALLAVDTKALTWRRGIIITALALFAVITRVASIALIPALLASVLFQAGRKGKIALGVLFAAGVVFIAVALAIGRVPLIGGMLAGGHGLRLDLIDTFRTYRLALSATALYPSSSPLANDIWHAVVAIPMLIGAVLFVVRHVQTPAWWFLFTYSSLLVLSPLVETRYAWPLSPLLAAWLVMGLQWVFARVPVAKLKPVAAMAVFMVLVAASVGAVVRMAQLPAPAALQNDPPTLELFDEVRKLNGPGGMTARVAFPNPRVMTLTTGVTAMGMPWGEERDILDEYERKQITHVVVPARGGGSADRINREIVRHRLDKFTRTFQNSRYELYRRVSPSLPLP